MMTKREGGLREKHEDASCDPAKTACPDACEADDEICTDEIDRHTEDAGMLQGTLIDTGAAIAGVMPVELPQTRQQRKREREHRIDDSSECEKCR